MPLALGLGAGAALQKPLAIAVVGGLLVSTLFTLIVAPVIYVTLERGRMPVQAPRRNGKGRLTPLVDKAHKPKQEPNP